MIPPRGSRRADERRAALNRLPIALGSAVCFIGVAAVPTRAHGLGGGGHGSVPLPVVVFLPVLAGIAGGILAVRGRLRSPAGARGPISGRLLGVLVLALSGTLVGAAVSADPGLGSGSVLGGVGALWLAARVVDRGALDALSAGLTLTGICAHRVLEGLAIAALYTTGTAVGTLGALVVSGHTALETALVGGLPALSRRRALAGAGLVQLGYVSGAGIGLALGAAIPPAVRTACLGLLGGGLLVLGVRETRCGSGHAHATDRVRVPSTTSDVDRDHTRS